MRTGAGSDMLKYSSVISPVDVPPVADPDHDYREGLVFNAVQYSVISLPNTIEIFARELFAPLGARIPGQCLNLPSDFSSWLGRQVFEFLGCGWLGWDPITFPPPFS